MVDEKEMKLEEGLAIMQNAIRFGVITKALMVRMVKAGELTKEQADFVFPMTVPDVILTEHGGPVFIMSHVREIVERVKTGAPLEHFTVAEVSALMIKLFVNGDGSEEPKTASGQKYDEDAYGCVLYLTAVDVWKNKPDDIELHEPPIPDGWSHEKQSIGKECLFDIQSAYVCKERKMAIAFVERERGKASAIFGQEAPLAN